MTQKNLALVFSGYGSQHQGMLRDLREFSDISIELARLLDAAEALCGLQLGKAAESGPDEMLADIRVAWPLLFIADYLWARHALVKGVNPQVLAGHDVGEYAALAHAGVVSPTAALDLVIKLSKLLAAAVKDSDGAMLVVLGLSAQRTAALLAAAGLSDQIWLACDDSADQLMLGGARPSLEALIPLLQDAGARRTLFATRVGAFNTPLVRNAADQYRGILEQTELRDARIPVILNATATTVMHGPEFLQPLCDASVSTIRWRETIARIARMSPVIIVESGPGSRLSDLNDTNEQVEYYSLAQSGTIKLLNRL